MNFPLVTSKIVVFLMMTSLPFLTFANDALTVPCEQFLAGPESGAAGRVNYERLLEYYTGHAEKSQVGRILDAIESSPVFINAFTENSDPTSVQLAAAVAERVERLQDADWQILRKFARALRERKKVEQVDREKKAVENKVFLQPRLIDQLRLNGKVLDRPASVFQVDDRTLVAQLTGEIELEVLEVIDEKLVALDTDRFFAFTNSQPAWHRTKEGRLLVAVRVNRFLQIYELKNGKLMRAESPLAQKFEPDEISRLDWVESADEFTIRIHRSGSREIFGVNSDLTVRHLRTELYTGVYLGPTAEWNGATFQHLVFNGQAHVQIKGTPNQYSTNLSVHDASAQIEFFKTKNRALVVSHFPNRFVHISAYDGRTIQHVAQWVSEPVKDRPEKQQKFSFTITDTGRIILAAQTSPSELTFSELNGETAEPFSVIQLPDKFLPQPTPVKIKGQDYLLIGTQNHLLFLIKLQGEAK